MYIVHQLETSRVTIFTLPLFPIQLLALGLN
jgi:hypothetical protein